MNLRAPGADSGWLMKDAHACGGWHIRRATSADRADGPSRYFQREANGTPMSATFIASANGVDRLGFNRQIVRRFGDRPFVFCGVIGPVELPGAVARRVDEVLHPLAAAFALRGLGSVDFLLDGNSIAVLEINPRPPASLALYGPGVFAAHCRACAGQPVSMPAPANRSVRGIETVFAPRRVDLDPATAQAIAALPDCHDWPAAARFEAGDPVCSVAASADTAAAVENLLTQHSLSVHRLLDPLP